MDSKALHLMEYVDLARPELAGVKTAAAPAEALVQHLATGPRPRFRFEYERKPEMLDFLRSRYRAWRTFDPAAADRIAAMSIESAQGPRALTSVAALGKAWWATGDPRYGQAFERFYRSVPTGEMFSWGDFNGSQGSIELDAWFLLEDCPGFSPEGRIAVLDHLHAISDYAWDEATSRWTELCLGPEGHNWYLHGMHVLPFIGLLFPEFKRAPFFLRTGWSVVEEHLRGHYKADGGARETTLGYQAGSMLCMWDFYCIARRNGCPMTRDFESRLLTATRFLLRLMAPDGGLPSFGDGGSRPGDLTPLAATAAALTGDGECKWYAEHARKHLAVNAGEADGELPESSFWRTGLAGAAAYAATRARNPHHASVLMGPTGYVAMRSSDRPDACYMAVAAADRGPIVTSHGHNEIFSLDVHAGGTRFVGEMGCCPYGVSPGRLYDVSTPAHSTLTVDGREQLPLKGEWRWGGRVMPAVRRWISEPTHDFFDAVHEGYYEYQADEILHARKVFFVKSRPSGPGYWIVIDWLLANGEHDYKAYFHGTVPGRMSGRKILLGEAGGPGVAIVPPAGDALSLERVKDEGLTAYIRERKLKASHYPCFAYGKRAASDALVWAMVPVAPDESVPAVTRLPVTANGIEETPHGACGVRVAFPNHVDELCVSHKGFDADLEFGDHHVFGLMAFRRRSKAGREVMRIDHSVLDGVCGR